MEEHTYFISEVSRLVGVEPHVLRYWEEELDLKIRRNSQGKRCYTREDVERFREAKRWKDKGMQLKAVKEILEEGMADHERGVREKEAEMASEWTSHPTGQICKNEAEAETDRYQAQGDEAEAETNRYQAQEDEAEEDGPLRFEVVTMEEPSDSVKKFELLLDSLIARALERNNEKLVQEICDEILQRLEVQIEEKTREAVEQELMQEMLREGERESAAAGQSRREGIWKRWKRRLEKYWDL
ncbi:MAG: helix-turn-helix domain-containing protein [Lachnospiraceae bacterium]|nr:helix-turn-helix domain-containing protein [Lachnospiraceae bacterium]